MIRSAARCVAYRRPAEQAERAPKRADRGPPMETIRANSEIPCTNDDKLNRATARRIIVAQLPRWQRVSPESSHDCSTHHPSHSTSELTPNLQRVQGFSSGIARPPSSNAGIHHFRRSLKQAIDRWDGRVCEGDFLSPVDLSRVSFGRTERDELASKVYQAAKQEFPNLDWTAPRVACKPLRKP